MASTPPNPEGWIIKVPTLGMEPDTRPTEQLFAVWESDAATACRLVEVKANLTNDQIPQTHAELTLGQLRGIGMKEKGDVALISTSM